MPEDHQSESSLSEEDVAILARYAGLAITEERLPLVTRELNIAQQAANDLLTAPSTDISGVGDQFDPAWPNPSKKRGAR